MEEVPKEKEIIEKDTIPHFFPTYRVKRRLYPIPIILVVAVAIHRRRLSKTADG